MEHYEIIQFNQRRLQRGEQYCYKAEISVGGEYEGWSWLRMTDIKKIMKDTACSISGHEDYIKETK